MFVQTCVHVLISRRNVNFLLCDSAETKNDREMGRRGKRPECREANQFGFSRRGRMGRDCGAPSVVLESAHRKPRRDHFLPLLPVIRLTLSLSACLSLPSRCCSSPVVKTLFPCRNRNKGREDNTRIHVVPSSRNSSSQITTPPCACLTISLFFHSFCNDCLPLNSVFVSCYLSSC